VRMDSDSSDSSDNDLFEFLDFLHEFGTANDRRHESETESETENETENETEGNVNYPINRFVPFYERRKDIFDMFNDEQIVRTFRFDKQAILYITGLVEDSLPKSSSQQVRSEVWWQMCSGLVSGLLDVPSMLLPMLSVA